MRIGRLLRLIRRPLARELSTAFMALVLSLPVLGRVSVVFLIVLGLMAPSFQIAVGPDPGEDEFADACGRGDQPRFAVDVVPDCVKH